MDEPDYISIAPALKPGRYCVLLMKYHSSGDEYLAVKSSEALPEVAARSLAQSWAAALRLEIRQ